MFIMNPFSGGLQRLFSTMSDIPSVKDKVDKDPLLDRRTGEDRRKGNDLEFFRHGGIERRNGSEYRQKNKDVPLGLSASTE